jgi:hypothetical protein
MPLGAGVSTTSAPNAFNNRRRSMLIDSGMVKTSLYPRAAATMANPIPVLPEVGSTSVVVPGAMSPRFSASRIMLLAIRSLTELAGFWLSSLHTTWAPQSEVMRFSWTRGVFPTSSKTLAAILGGGGGTEDDEAAEEALMVERRW